MEAGRIAVVHQFQGQNVKHYLLAKNNINIYGICVGA
jgi:hypothetical protein